MPTNSFSRRNNCGVAAEIKVREGAPEEVRIALIDTSYDCGWGPVALRTITCKVLRKKPDPNSWSEYPNVDREVRDFVDNCPWFKVYDIIEALYAAMAKQDVLTRKSPLNSHITLQNSRKK
jgi:AbiJ N-terminal domain 4